MENRSEIVDRIRAGYDVAAPKISDFAEEHRAREESSLYYCRLRELCRGKHLKALEIGVGGGFLSIFLARLGCEMTAVDNSDGILAQARRNFAEAGADIDLRKIEDAQDLDFPEGTFDLIVSRKVTWHFTEPRKAYASWMKALRPGGTMMVFDGNYYLKFNDPDYMLAEQQNADYLYRCNGNTVNTDEEGFRRKLYMSSQRRPAWDISVLLGLGAPEVSADVWESIKLTREDGTVEWLPYTYFITARKGSK